MWDGRGNSLEQAQRVRDWLHAQAGEELGLARTPWTPRSFSAVTSESGEL